MRYPYQRILAILIILHTGTITAQDRTNSSIVIHQNEVSDFSEDRSYIAKKTAMKSALLPGWGQLTNKQYIKIPFIYVALGATGYIIVDNYRQYQSATQAYLYRIDNDPNTEVERYRYSSESYIRSQKSNYRQYLDYSVLIATIIYTLNILDAAVFSHLQEFDISSDLALRPSLHYRPIPYLAGPHTPSLGITLLSK